MSQENLEMIRAGYAKHGMGFSLSKWNPDAVPDLFDPAIEWVEPDVSDLPWQGTHRGPQAVAEKVFATIPAFEELELEPKDFFDLGEYVLAVGQGHLRAKASGKEWNGPFAHVWTVRNGKIVRWQGFADARCVAEVFN